MLEAPTPGRGVSRGGLGGQIHPNPVSKKNIKQNSLPVVYSFGAQKY